jgi:hypothetical protein
MRDIGSCAVARCRPRREPKVDILRRWLQPGQLKHGYTIEELGLSDPRFRPPLIDGWDGLCRVMGHTSAAAALQADMLEAPTPFVPSGMSPNTGDGRVVVRRAFSSTEAEWLSRLDGIQPTPSRRLIDFLDSDRVPRRGVRSVDVITLSGGAGRVSACYSGKLTMELSLNGAMVSSVI